MGIYIYITTHLFGVFGFVFLMSGLVFGVLRTCILGLDLYLGIWTCIWVSGFVLVCLDLYLGTVYFQGVCMLVGCDYGVHAPTTP